MANRAVRMMDIALETDGERAPVAPTAAAPTLVETVMATIRQRIAARSLTPGARLPSIRAFAQSMQVSKSTVVEAYERLAAEGAIRSRPSATRTLMRRAATKANAAFRTGRDAQTGRGNPRARVPRHR